MSLVGIFHQLAFQTWPAAAEFTVYAALYGGLGEGTMELTINQLETEREIFNFQRWSAFADQTMTVNLEIPVRRCIFPGPGRYRLAITFDKEELAFRLLDLRTKGRAP
jgi:hypothetical protein